MPRPVRPFEECYEVSANGCWLFKVANPTTGYARYRGRAAHRVAWELFRGPIPPGLDIDHQCHNQSDCPGGVCEHRRCVNPDHLEPVTRRVNLLRGKRYINKTECIHGHPRTPDNLYVRPDGGRSCRECLRRRSRDYNARRAISY